MRSIRDAAAHHSIDLAAARREGLPRRRRHRRRRRLDGRGIARPSWPASPLTAGADVVGAEWQNRRHVDPNWYVGKGKAEELLAAKRETGFGMLVADDELSPAQQRSLEELLNVKVIDRSRLILDIFAQHAQTHEGRLQVELAQLEYQLPRLTRLWTHLSRTQGGIGSRGPGESQLETDRRIIRDPHLEDEGAGRAGPPAARDRGPRP